MVNCFGHFHFSEHELISIYYGSDVTEEDAEAFRSQVEEANASCDVESSGIKLMIAVIPWGMVLEGITSRSLSVVSSAA